MCRAIRVLAPRAILGRARLALDHGRLAIAEASVTPLLLDRGEVGRQASRLADQVDLFMGRRRAISRRIERRWAMSPDQAGLLRLHWQLDSQPSPILAMGETLDRMARQAPEDDRVWLGRADLATSSGRYDQADELLKRCESRRPDDPEVLEARLNWALEVGAPRRGHTRHIPHPGVPLFAAEVAAVIARLAALRGDAAAERAALEQRVELERGDTAAWDRLAELAAHARVGRPRGPLPSPQGGDQPRPRPISHADAAACGPWGPAGGRAGTDCRASRSPIRGPRLVDHSGAPEPRRRRGSRGARTPGERGAVGRFRPDTRRPDSRRSPCGPGGCCRPPHATTCRPDVPRRRSGGRPPLRLRE